MQLQEVMAELEAAGTEQARKIYARHEAAGLMFGVSFAKLGEMKKRIKKNQALAEGLWDTGVLEARILAAMVADPERVTFAQLDGWAHDIRERGTAGYLADLAAQTPFALEIMAAWIEDEGEMVARAGWSLVANLAMGNRLMSDEALEALLPTIEARIHGAPNRAKEGMYNAMMAIGTRSDALEQAAIASARRIGKVDVDHGETSCKTPDAEPYIIKARAHRRAKDEKAAKPKVKAAAKKG